MNLPASGLALTAGFLLAASALAQDVDTTAAPSANPRALASVTPAGPPPVLPLSSPQFEVIWTSVATSTTSDVPGVPGAKFAGTAAFDRPWLSQNNAHWAISADTDLATTMDDVLLVDGTVVEREGTQPPYLPVGEFTGIFDQRIGVNDSGAYAFAYNSSATVNDDYVVKFEPGFGYTIVAQEGQPFAPLVGATADDNLETVVLLNDGRVGYEADLVDGGGVTTTTDNFIVLDTAIIARNGTTIPGNQAAAAMEFWDTFDFEAYWHDNNNNHLIQGDLTGATTGDQVVVYNGDVVLQEGQIIPGSGFADPIDATGIVEVWMSHAGDWFARGNNDITEQDWVVRNGSVYRKEGDPVYNAPGRFRILTATLSEAQEVPPTGSPATGTALITVDTLLNELIYNVTYTGLTSAETAAHIHGFAPPGVNAGVLFAFPLGTPKNGTFTYLEADEANILGGLTYVNIHTVTNGGGEIRGQLTEVTEVWDDRDFADCFFLHVANNAGDVVIGGVTNGHATRNGVMTLNNTIEIAREGDPIDVDGNGMFDDDAFFNTFGNDDGILYEDGTFVFVATIRNGAGTQTAQGVFRRNADKPSTPFCFGDGLDPNVTTPCGAQGTMGPCLNFGAAKHGCANSVNAAGALLDATGITNPDSIVLAGSGMPATVSGIYLQGDALDDIAFGDGVRCAGGQLIRLRTKANVGGASQFPEMGDPSVSTRGMVTPGSGAIRYYQLYYRNAAAAFCPDQTFNVTHGQRIVW